jgi:predicted amidophosphoribosyltransferase
MLQGLLDLLVPKCCAGCGSPDSVLCARCRQTMAGPFAVERAHGPPLYALTGYDGAARRAVLAYKERGRRELAESFGSLVAQALLQLPGSAACCLVPVPSRPAAARKRGGQHMLLVARHTGRPVRPVLHLDRHARDSVGLDVTARAANLAGRLTCDPIGHGTEVILLDDVITTGATAAAGTAVLTEAGAKVVAVLALTAARSSLALSA